MKTNQNIHPDDDMFTGNEGHYFSVGEQMSAFAEKAFHLSKSQNPFLLELPCGYGRVTRHLVKKFTPSHIYSADIMAPAVDFCADTFFVNGRHIKDPVYEFQNIQSEKFDIGLMGSLITHLSNNNSELVIKNFFSKIRPGGIGVVTTHGEQSRVLLGTTDCYQVGESARKFLIEGYDSGEFAFVNYNSNHTFEKKTVDYIGDSYGVSLIPTEWVYNVCKLNNLHIIEHIVGGWDGHQDVFFIEKLY